MINMARSMEEMQAGMPTMPEAPVYPYGLCICLTHDELDKLGLDADCEVGDMIHIMAMAKVTSISKNATSDGENCRVELQITDMSVEDEDLEYDEPEQETRIGYRLRPDRLYK